MATHKGDLIMVKTPRLARAAVFAAAAGLLAGLILAPAAASAQEKKSGLLGPWAATAEVSYVVTGGNTSTSALSLGTSLVRKWANDTLLFKTYILKSNATTTTRTAQGTVDDFDILEDRITRKVAENFALAGQYDRRISKKLTGQAGLSWDRNRFAGVDDRFIFTTGFGYAWVDGPRTQIRSSAGLTYTLRQYVGQDMESFAGFRFTFGAEQKILDTSKLASQFVFDDNLKNTPDWRFDWTNSVTASISKALALKISLRTLYAHVPALQNLPLIDDLGEPTGLTVPYPLKKLDTFMTTSRVINF
jgi:putative salt-induced outer membrane protein YdiY